MANLSEISRAIHDYGKTDGASNPVREFAWVLRETVKQDTAQAEGILGEVESLGLLAQSMIYAQRLIEIGYVFTEVYVRDEYRAWEPSSDSPKVIDLGGDPGAFSALYWKTRAPGALVTVVEANPSTATVMNNNLARRGVEGINVINAAIAAEDNQKTTLNLHRPRKGWHTQDFVGERNQSTDQDRYTVEVPTITLSSLIEEEEPIDLLKVDIEGSELIAMTDLLQSGKLRQVRQILMEFHHDPTELPENSLLAMLDLLRTGGYAVNQAHITGAGLRRKTPVPLERVADIADINEKVFLTFSAVRID